MFKKKYFKYKKKYLNSLIGGSEDSRYIVNTTNFQNINTILTLLKQGLKKGSDAIKSTASEITTMKDQKAQLEKDETKRLTNYTLWDRQLQDLDVKIEELKIQMTQTRDRLSQSFEIIFENLNKEFYQILNKFEPRQLFISAKQNKLQIMSEETKKIIKDILDLNWTLKNLGISVYVSIHIFDIKYLALGNYSQLISGKIKWDETPVPILLGKVNLYRIPNDIDNPTVVDDTLNYETKLFNIPLDEKWENEFSIDTLVSHLTLDILKDHTNYTLVFNSSDPIYFIFKNNVCTDCFNKTIVSCLQKDSKTNLITLDLKIYIPSE